MDAEWEYAGARLTCSEFRATEGAGAAEDLPPVLRSLSVRGGRCNTQFARRPGLRTA